MTGAKAGLVLSLAVQPCFHFLTSSGRPLEANKSLMFSYFEKSRFITHEPIHKSLQIHGGPRIRLIETGVLVERDDVGCVCLCVRTRGVAGRHRRDGEILQSKVSQKRKGSWEVQVPVCRLLCKVSGDCQVVLRRLLDREVRGRLITILRGKGEVLYSSLCGLWSWVSSTESRRWQHAG